MGEITKADVGELTNDTLELFLKIWESPERSAFVSNPENGPRVSVLASKGFLRAAGKIGKKQRWQIVAERFKNPEVIQFAREVIKL